METVDSPSPMDVDVTLKQVNKSGFPFQLKIVREITNSKNEHGWLVSSTEHPWTSKDKEASGYIDIVLSHQRIPTARMVVECKRIRSNDGRQLRWVFLANEDSPQSTGTASCFEVEGRGERVGSGSYEWRDIRIWDNVFLNPRSYESQFCILSADEPQRQPLLERLASEVLESIEGIAEEEARMIRSQKGNRLRLFIFPTIVTNAELSICRFDSNNVNIEDGTLTAESVALTTVPFVRFRKSVGTDFPNGEFYGLNDANKARERTVFIVNSSRISEFLTGWEFAPLSGKYAVQYLME